MQYLVLICLGLFIYATSAVKKNIHVYKNNKHCMKRLSTVNFSLRESYCEQPLFVNFVQKTDENLMLDNICHTFFPLPDDTTTFQVYISKVYVDGSTELISFIGTQMETGISKFGCPFCTFTDTVFGYAGCDTHLVYRCEEYGDCGALEGTLVFGLSTACKPLGISCLRRVEELVNENKIKVKDFYLLPMQLPNRCVTQQICMKPENPFFNHLPGHRGKKHSITIVVE